MAEETKGDPGSEPPEDEPLGPRNVFESARHLLSPQHVAEQTSRVVRFLGELAPASELDFRSLRRMLWHAVVVGVAAGGAGAAFFAILELFQQGLLERLAGYVPLRAHGEPDWFEETERVYRPWLLLLLPGLGALLAGLIMRLAPETRGGGTDAVIEAYHRGRGLVRPRVAWVKALASLATLGSGGAGGREGPTMQIGAALGSLSARFLGVSNRERRVLLLAGVAAGISAVFRTPLGAALLAVEVLYREGLESEALVPCILSSVVSYSIVISIYGESTLLAHAARYPFIPAHLPLYMLLALGMSAMALAFIWMLRTVRRIAGNVPVPEWAKPALGGLAVGVLAVAAIGYFGVRSGVPGHGLGILGGGYGAAQLAITGGAILPQGWAGVQLLFLLGLIKALASSLTIGSGGSAGDFAPSLAIGGLMGGAFGQAAALLLQDQRIDPGAFALVGMGAFYGGIAHVPLAALVLVCELAGSYDLLVPLMLAEAVAFVVLRGRSLYPAQVATMRDSPVHRRAMDASPLSTARVADFMKPAEPWQCFDASTRGEEMLRRAAEAEHQEVFPVIGPDGKLRGIVTFELLRSLAAEDQLEGWIIAQDIMQRPAAVKREHDLSRVARVLVEHELRAVPVVDDQQRVVGFVDQAEIARALVQSSEDTGSHKMAAVRDRGDSIF